MFLVCGQEAGLERSASTIPVCEKVAGRARRRRNLKEMGVSFSVNFV